MSDIYQHFAEQLGKLLPEGQNAVEITVPRRATRLLIVNYGEHLEGHSTITLTETTRRMRDLAEMRHSDFEYMGVHPGDHPALMSLSFDCHGQDGIRIAAPIQHIDHLMNKSQSPIQLDDEGNLKPYDDAVLDKLVVIAEDAFRRYRDMGHFGEKAQRSPCDLAIDWKLIHAHIMVENRMYREMEQLKRKHLEEEMAFLEKNARARQDE